MRSQGQGLSVSPPGGAVSSDLFVGVEQLGSHLHQHYHHHRGQDGLRDHVGGVVHRTVQPAQAVGAHLGDAGEVDLAHPAEGVVIVLPDDVPGQKAAQVPQQADHKGADPYPHRVAGKALADDLGQAQHGEGQQVVQQHAADLGGQGLAVGQVVDALDELHQAVDKGGHQAPLGPVAVAHQQDGHHAEQGDGAAVGHQGDLDLAEHGGQGHHQGALHQDTGLGVGLGHTRVFSSFLVVHKNKKCACKRSCRRTGCL